MIIKETNINKAKEQIKKSKPPIIIQSPSNEFSRKILEYGKFQILLLPKGQRDRLRQLDSSLNHTLAKLAAKNKVAIGVGIDKISALPPKQKAIQLSHLKQNIKICRKAKCRLTLINAKNEKDAQALLQSLGASSQQIKD